MSKGNKATKTSSRQQRQGGTSGMAKKKASKQKHELNEHNRKIAERKRKEKEYWDQ